MRVRVLGCSGGIGGARHTTSLLIDDDCLIDAGSGALRLSLDELARIEHVFLTHSHLDHVLALPLLLDSVSGLRERPVTVHATAETLAILRAHLFNWLIWPDFNRIPDAERPFMVYRTIETGRLVRLGDREITPIPASHTVPAVGYHLRGARASLIFSGDTESFDGLWQAVASSADLGDLIIEVSFTDDQEALARVSKHYSPRLLATDLAGLSPAVRVWLTHLKPGREAAIVDEVNRAATACRCQALTPDQVFEL